MEPFNGKPHNHVDWLEAKIARSELSKSKRKTPGEAKAPSSPANADPKRLRIRERMIQSLTTNVSLSLDEAEKIANAALHSPTHLKE
jgi:hypothetical protein